MEKLIQQYMDFWETAVHETLANEKVSNKYQELIRHQMDWFKNLDMTSPFTGAFSDHDDR